MDITGTTATTAVTGITRRRGRGGVPRAGNWQQRKRRRFIPRTYMFNHIFLPGRSYAGDAGIISCFGCRFPVFS